MARPLRIEYPGAWYHVINRGQGRREIFRTDEQREFFLSLLEVTTERFNADWHAYCLMDNHYHLMLHTPEGNLQRIMRHVNGVYTQHFNHKEKRDGALFRGRYKSILVEAESYWLQLSRYIHRNPLEAGVVKQLRHYRWSSYRAYTGQSRSPGWLSTRYILRGIGQRNVQKRYAEFIRQGGDDEVCLFYKSGSASSILGSKDFREQATKGILEHIDIPEIRQQRVRPSLKRVVQDVAEYFDLPEKDVWKKTRGRGATSPARVVTMYLCHEVLGMTLTEIAEKFELASYASAGSSIRRVRTRVSAGEFAKLICIYN